MLVDSDIFVFFKQKTAYEMRISDWSSDVCSSDLPHGAGRRPRNGIALRVGDGDHGVVERRVDVRDARRDDLLIATAQGGLGRLAGITPWSFSHPRPPTVPREVGPGLPDPSGRPGLRPAQNAKPAVPGVVGCLG